MPNMFEFYSNIRNWFKVRRTDVPRLRGKASEKLRESDTRGKRNGVSFLAALAWV